MVLFFAIATSSSYSIGYAEDIDDNDTSSVSDPFENVNRAIYSFNSFLDKILIKPIAKGYRFVVPDLARRGVRNVLTNLSEPLTLINSALQGDKQNGFEAFWRFTINSTYGIGGIFDVAKDAGLEHRKEDFGQTAGVYGAGQGVYLMLPILGPSNGRDAFGKVVDIFTDPFDYILTDEATFVRSGVNGIDAREGALSLVDQINRTSLDPYATIRSLYTQKRWDEIRNGKRAPLK
jgi:phospholipid-binding lipoprotein MlaA